ncbi:MAG TPA: class I SAM-dependent methyltransferase [Pyrinomonadaceae bacterium]|jgi:ubiquinone/menaquinone biosynthesis C-methylase UbiE|nr:class I SAM-dependent methyltransferase [Pyrinomonadaceae bacterium]
MSTEKSEKELAYLHELCVATDWGERFAALVDEHVKLPEEGRALYVASGTGAHALALATRAPHEVTLVCVDESEERLELARAKASVVRSDKVEFRHAQLEALAFEDEAFDLVVGDASLVAPERLPEVLAEMVRVAAPGAAVSMSVASASSFGEFFSVYWEALVGGGYGEQAEEIAQFIKELPTVSELEAMAAREALEGVESWTSKEEFDFPSGREFLDAPLVRDFLLERWLGSLPDDEARAAVLEEIARIIDEDRSEGDFSLSVKATIVVGCKTD